MTQLNNALILSAILTLSAALPVVAANSEKRLSRQCAVGQRQYQAESEQSGLHRF